MAEGKQYFTVKDVFDATVKLAKADPYFEQYNKICVLDYDLILRDCEDGTLYRAEFGVLGDVSYGESEGIYGDIYLYGMTPVSGMKICMIQLWRTQSATGSSTTRTRFRSRASQCASAWV